MDGGGGASPFFDCGRSILAPALTYRRLPRLDAVLVSHTDMDHARGLRWILEHFEVGCLVWSSFSAADDSVDGRALREIARRRNIPEKILERGDVFSLTENVRLEVVWPDDTTVDAVAKVLWHEARGVPSDTEVACVVWTACNRVDAGLAGTVLEAVTAPGQYAYNPDAPVEPRLESLARDVLLRWAREKNGQDQVGRVLPADFMWFHGDGEHNWFRNQYRGGDTWYYTLESPYET